jgi:uncharacterized protein
MVSMRTLSKIDLEDYVLGANILGCGGGGSAESGLELINHAFDTGLTFKLSEFDDFKNDDIFCIISGVGGGISEEQRKKVELYTKKISQDKNARFDRLQKSIVELENYIGKKIATCIPSETGGGNGVMPMYINALNGKPSIDGDGCGRAKPELGLSLTNVAGIPIAPISIITPFMETVIVKSAVDDTRGEDLTRTLAIASGGSVTAARSSGMKKDYRNGIAHGQVTRCQKIGAAIRSARELKSNPVEAFEAVSGATKLFEGKVKSFEMEGRGGFNWGNWYIDGTSSYLNHKMRIWFKNEFLIGWMDEKQYITCPDLICVVDSKTCQGYSNFAENKTHNGKLVSVYGIKAIDQWRTPKGIEVFGPKHFGFNIEYKPLEKLV